jgi:hypothetical protein
MIVQNQPQLHLTYCLNVHPGERWAANFAAIQQKATAIKERVAPDQWFGLGLRLSAEAAQDLSNPDLQGELLDFCAEQQMYPFTINGFPYGKFHQASVKEEVYAPDWRTPERLDYTLQLIDILAATLPESVEGSISTVPCSFKPWIQTEDDVRSMACNLGAAVAYLAALAEDTGKLIHLGLEPEPDCFLETTPETIAFYNDWLLMHAAAEVGRILKCNRRTGEEFVRRHLGICFDTCHVALQYEDPLESLRAYEREDIRISKIQLSAALQSDASPESLLALESYQEETYLHQVKARTNDGSRVAWYDLPDALEELPQFPNVEELRVHFHVPLFFQGHGPLQSTVGSLTPDFFHYLRGGICSHLEIETYTFDVLPPEVHPGDLVRSFAREYAWVLGKLAGD